MTVYLDTSDLVKLYVDEPGADQIRDLVSRADVIATSVVSYAEARSVLARRRREGLITSAECAAAVSQLDLDWPRIATIPVGPDLARSAGYLADKLSIRGLDAVQLAAFEQCLADWEDDLHFSSSDERLIKAAKKLG